MVPTVAGARDLLAELGASERLLRHGELVLEAGQELLAAVAVLGVELDSAVVAAGCLLHDVGKAEFANELHGPGNAHEAVGERMLLAHGVDARVARMCRSHAQWRSMSVDLEDLIVALADITWKGRRSEVLEARLVDELARRSGRDRWDVFVVLDDAAERVADGGAERLLMSTLGAGPPEGPL